MSRVVYRCEQCRELVPSDQDCARCGRQSAGIVQSVAPPVGIEPRFLWLERRRDNLYLAVQRYRDATLAPNIEWLEEIVSIEKEIQSRS